MSDTLRYITALSIMLVGGFGAASVILSTNGVPYIVTNMAEPPFFEPFDSDADMWDNIMAAYPSYDTMTDLQKTTALRTWASQHLYVSGNVNVYDHNLFDNEHPSKIFNHFARFHNGNAGVMCTGYAHALCVLYDYAGFPSLKYDYGGDGCSHSVTLVRIMDAGEPKIIVQDAYFDYYYTWPNGTAMSVYEVFAEVDAGGYDTVVPVYEKTIDYAVFVPFDPHGVNKAEFVARIDDDSAVYRVWFTPEWYQTSSEYIKNRDEFLGDDAANDLQLLTEQRNIVHFNPNGHFTHPDFSILESDSL